MKPLRIALTLAVVFALCSAFTSEKGKDKEHVVYAFGLAASFNDSVMYITDMQVLDSVKLSKEGFLPHRSIYSSQLQTYVEYQLQKPNYTCIIFFSDNKAKLTKEADKIKTKYTKTPSVVMVPIAPSAFSFTKPME
ncbi:MAG: hypothetical protein LBL78_04470 [Prevotellaceae bacterium]|jgi:hypothetical protein|nr:hypothetical protein [Prevotellaceae bacterium]